MKTLQNGDYCENLTKEQFEELIDIEGHEFKLDYIKLLDWLVYHLGVLKRQSGRKNLLSFEEFKQRAINTFRK